MNPVPHKERSLLERIRKNKNAYFFLIPIFLFLCTFKYYTFFTAIVESFFKLNGDNVIVCVGLENYRKVLTENTFWISMKNVGIITICNVIICVTFPMLAAIMVYSCKNKHISNFFKILYIIPMVVPSLVVFLMWKWIYAFDTGAINQLLRLCGLDNLVHSWLGEPGTALAAIIMIGFPFIGAFGLQFLVYLGALLNISVDICESARLDGIKWWQNIIYIELPLLKPQMKMFVMLAIINSMQSFENILVLTEGGPGKSTIVPALYMYKQAFTYSNMGYASAIGVLLFLLVLLFTVLNYKFVNTQD